MDAEPSRLRELLEQLHAELLRHPPADARGQDLVRGLREQIAGLEAPAVPAAEGAAPAQPLRERLQEMVLGLEESHPHLAGTIEQTMVALSNMGL